MKEMKNIKIYSKVIKSFRTVPEWMRQLIAKRVHALAVLLLQKANYHITTHSPVWRGQSAPAENGENILFRVAATITTTTILPCSGHRFCSPRPTNTANVLLFNRKKERRYAVT